MTDMTVAAAPDRPLTTTVPLDLSRRGRDAHVTLVRPPIVIFPRGLTNYGPVPPLGLAYIAAVLRQVGHDVAVIDAPGEGMDRHEDFPTPVGDMRRIGLTPEAIVDRIDPATSVIGITHMFVHEWPQVKQVAEAAKARFPHVPVVVGGENATACHDWILQQCEAIDACVLGEGEATAVELVSRLVEGRSLNGMDGVALASRHRASGHDASLSARMRRLHTIPRPAWDLVPLESYWRYRDFFGVNRGRFIPMLATRGCPYQCSFCSSPQMWTTRYVVRDPAEVVDEIVHYVDTYGVENVNFCDLTAIVKRGWTLRFCDALEEQAPGLTWQLPVGTRAEALDREVLQRLWDTGCRNIGYAPESGSPRMLEVYDKRVDLERLLDSLREARRIGIRTRVNIIIGHPEERRRDRLQSVRFLLRAAWAGCDDASVIMFCPYPGSADFKELVDSGRHVFDEAALYVGLSRSSVAHVSHNPELDGRQLHRLQLEMAALFYAAAFVLHPSRAVKFVRAQVTGRETTFLDQLVRIKWQGFRERTGRRRPRSGDRTTRAAVTRDPGTGPSGSPRPSAAVARQPPVAPIHPATSDAGGGVSSAISQ